MTFLLAQKYDYFKPKCLNFLVLISFQATFYMPFDACISNLNARHLILVLEILQTIDFYMT